MPISLVDKMKGCLEKRLMGMHQNKGLCASKWMNGVAVSAQPGVGASFFREPYFGVGFKGAPKKSHFFWEQDRQSRVFMGGQSADSDLP